MSTKPTIVSPTQARRIAIRAQLLDGSATTVLDSIRRLGFLQLDPTARVTPTQFLVLWSRLETYEPGELAQLLAQRELFEWIAFVYPRESLPALLSRMQRWPPGDTAWPRRVREWLQTNEPFRRYVLRELERNGPMLSRQFEDRALVSWPSSGWTGGRNVGRMLEFLTARGELATVGRIGKQRLFDLAERWYGDVVPLPHDEADAFFAEVRFRTRGVELRKGRWVAHPAADDRPVRRTTLLSPFDRLIYDRTRTAALFDFYYRTEIYVPKAERKCGYFVLPVLRGDRIVGRIDPEVDRRAGVLRVKAVHWESEPVSIEQTLSSLARFVGVPDVEWP
jgi:uncharacterized protein YcaQ